MKRQWISDDLIEHFTLLPRECALLDPLRGDHTRLGFAVLLKSFQLDGRFPTTPHEVPTPVIAFLAAQLDADPGVYLQYAWWGRTSDAHRAQIRALLGVRPATVEDATTLTVSGGSMQPTDQLTNSAWRRLCWPTARSIWLSTAWAD